METLTDHQLIAMLYTLIAEMEKNQRKLEELKQEAERRKLL